MPISLTLPQAIETVRGVLSDLAEMPTALATLHPQEAEAAARILDRLSEEITEAALMVRTFAVGPAVGGQPPGAGDPQTPGAGDPQRPG